MNVGAKRVRLMVESGRAAGVAEVAVAASGGAMAVISDSSDTETFFPDCLFLTWAAGMVADRIDALVRVVRLRGVGGFSEGVETGAAWGAGRVCSVCERGVFWTAEVPFRISAMKEGSALFRGEGMGGQENTIWSGCRARLRWEAAMA